MLCNMEGFVGYFWGYSMTPAPKSQANQSKLLAASCTRLTTSGSEHSTTGAEAQAQAQAQARPTVHIVADEVNQQGIVGV